VPRAWTILFSVAALGIGGAVLYANRSDAHGDDPWALAERSFASGDFRAAARQYEDFVARQPGSPLAPQALYQAAFIYADDARRRDDAIRTYRRLADEFPHHALADEALRHVGDLLLEDHQYAEAIRAYQDAVHRSAGSDRSAAAAAEVRIGEALFRSGDGPGTRSRCLGVLRRYPQCGHQRAEALNLLALTARRLEDSPRTALQRYEQLLREYPDSRYAPQAERQISALRRELGLPATPGGRPVGIRGRSVLVKLPTRSPSGEVFEDTGMLECLRVLLAARGVHVSLAKLAGWSGQAFAFYYDASDRHCGAGLMPPGEPERLAKDLGFRGCSLSMERSPERAWDRVARCLSDGQAVLTPASIVTPADWVLITGYDAASNRVGFYTTSGARRTATLDKLLRSLWAPEDCPGLGPRAGDGSHEIPLFVLGPGPVSREPGPALSPAVRRAISLCREHEEWGLRGGLSAWDELARDMAQVGGSGCTAAEAAGLGAWCASHLPQLTASRRQAAGFLRAWAASAAPGQRKHLELAARHYEGSARHLAGLAKAFNAALERRQSPGQPARPEVIVKRAAAEERAALRELEAVAEAP